MLNFTNGFSCAVNKDDDTVIINFIQRVPHFDSEYEKTEGVVENVDSIVMGKAVAGRLLNALKSMLGDEEIEE